MKTIVAILALIVSNSVLALPPAAQYMAMKYSDQVRIVLSKEKCDKAGFRGAAQRIDKQYLKMCWSLDQKTQMVHIQWEGGDFSEFPIQAFEPVEVQ